MSNNHSSLTTQADAEERAATQKQADLTLAMHWASVQKRQDSEDEAELRLLQRYQEEREAADIAREEAEAAAKARAQAAQWTAMNEQLEEKEHRATAANLEAAEEARLASKAAAAAHKQVLEEVGGLVGCSWGLGGVHHKCVCHHQLLAMIRIIRWRHGGGKWTS